MQHMIALMSDPKPANSVPEQTLTPTPMALSTFTVESAWIDYNGHMNVGYYGVAFDRAADVFTDWLGFDAAYRQRSRCSIYVLESRTGFLHELMDGERIAVDAQLLDFDHKRLHYFLRMLRTDDDLPCAWTEIMLMHMDMNTVSSTPMPSAALDKVRQLAQTHRQLPWPEVLRNSIGIRR